MFCMECLLGGFRLVSFCFCNHYLLIIKVCISEDIILNLLLYFLKGCVFMNDIYFAVYNPGTDSIEIYFEENLKIVFNCTRLNDNVYLEEPLDIAYLHRLSQEEPFNYIFFVLQPDGLQGYIEAMNVFN